MTWFFYLRPILRSFFFYRKSRWERFFFLLFFYLRLIPKMEGWNISISFPCNPCNSFPSLLKWNQRTYFLFFPSFNLKKKKKKKRTTPFLSIYLLKKKLKNTHLFLFPLFFLLFYFLKKLKEGVIVDNNERKFDKRK